MIKSKKSMRIVVSLYGVGVLFFCCRGPDYGSRCAERDTSSHCIQCKYCKAEMSGADASKLINEWEKKRDDR